MLMLIINLLIFVLLINVLFFTTKLQKSVVISILSFRQYSKKCLLYKGANFFEGSNEKIW